MRLLPTLLLLLWACPSRDDGPGDRRPTDPSETGDTGPAPTGDTGTLPSPLSASCALQADNALRAVCTVTVEPPQQVEVAFAPADGSGPERVHASDPIAAEHEIGLYFLRPETAYTWTARTRSDPAIEHAGTLLTGALPSGAHVTLSGDGIPTAPLIGTASPCSEGAYVVIVEPASGEVVWYQQAQGGVFGFVDAVSFTEDGTVLAISDGYVSESTLMGESLLHLRPEVELDEHVHHDVFRKDGLTWVIFQELITSGGGEHALDGFYVFDAAGVRVGEWHLADHFAPVGILPPTGFPQDTSHANAIWVGDDGTLLFSMRHLSAVAAIVGDPARPDFGDILWRMSHPGSAFGTDFAYTSAVSGPADFEQQHNVHLLPDGRMTMLDNRGDFDELTRVVDLSFDPASGTATFEREYTLPLHCDFQGGAWRTPAGNPLATCAPSLRGYEFDASTGELVWEGQLACESGPSLYVPRFVPLDW